MWTAQEFASVLKKRPKGGTFWTGSHRVVRYIRVSRPGNNGTVVAIMTELWRWRGKSSDKVELFVRTLAGTEVAEFLEPEKSQEFLEKLLTAPILERIEANLLPKVKKFITMPNKTYLRTW